MKRLVLLGATGSIGTSVRDVVRAHPDLFRLTGLAVRNSVEELIPVVEEFGIGTVAVSDSGAAGKARELLPGSVTVLAGHDGLNRLAELADADMVINAVVGSVGVEPTLRALRAGYDVALANKESLVMAGRLIMDTARRAGRNLVPIDSEHSAIHQCLRSGGADEVKRIILTASGGPFRTTPAADFGRITREQALAHPTWEMGAKISIDSATLMNKGLEVIEAHWLFGLPADRIGVVVHPESIVHSMVEFVDSSVISQMSVPDMRLPVHYAIMYPERSASPFGAIDLTETGPLSFQKPDMEKFRCLRLAFDALRTGGTMPCVLNAANEVVVQAFLENRTDFAAIPGFIEDVMSAHEPYEYTGLEDITGVDRWAREHAAQLVRKGAS